jgi:hypothetical protein
VVGGQILLEFFEILNGQLNVWRECVHFGVCQFSSINGEVMSAVSKINISQLGPPLLIIVLVIVSEEPFISG